MQKFQEILPLFIVSVVDLLQNGVQLSNFIQLDFCDFIKYFPFQGDLQPGKQEEVTGGQIW